MSLTARHALLALLALSAGCGTEPAGLRHAEGSALEAMAAPSATRSGGDADESRKIVMRDECDPRDPAWAATGGCLLSRGDVTEAEFRAELNSALSLSVIGHQAWQMNPTYRELAAGATLLVRNEGGRTHTFTEVAEFGGGPIPPLNRGLTRAPECVTAVNIPAGGAARVSGLSIGNHRYECCFHPWMRALVKVRPHQGDLHGNQDG